MLLSINSRVFDSAERRVAWRERVVVENVEQFFLFNDGLHLYVARGIESDGSFRWHWIKFADFGYFLRPICHLFALKHPSLHLRTRGHKWSYATVTLSQQLKKGYGHSGKCQVHTDWSRTICIPVGKIVLVRTVGSTRVEFSFVDSITVAKTIRL